VKLRVGPTATKALPTKKARAKGTVEILVVVVFFFFPLDPTAGGSKVGRLRLSEGVDLVVAFRKFVSPVGTSASTCSVAFF